MMWSRRQFTIAAGLAAPLLRGQSGTLTARQVVERIQKNLGSEWRTPTVDTFKAGDPDTPLTGIATTVMATFAVLQRAATAKRNFIITHEPTFYSHEDATKDLTSDPVFQAKQSFIEKNRLVVFRFHDHIHSHRPDLILTGMENILQWDKYRRPDNPHQFQLPPTSLQSLARTIQERVKSKTMRVIGDPQLQVTRAVLNPGYANPKGVMRAIQNPDVDLIVIGESREWEGVEYAQDAIASGMKKGMIIMGHAVSEENGMNECARWLKTFITEVPIEFMPAGEPFWSPL